MRAFRVANRSDARALRMCELALGRCLLEPERLRETALANIGVWERVGSCHPSYATRWRELLAMPPEAMRDVVLAGSDEGQALRANNPFAGIFSREERSFIQAAGQDEPTAA